MESTRRFILRSPSVVWLIDHPEVGAAARSEAADGSVFADLVLDDPTRLKDLYRAAVVHSVQANAPVGVTEELLRCSRVIAAHAERWIASPAADKPRLGALKGLRDRDELAAGLRDLVDSAPDERSRATIERLARYVTQELTTLKPDGASHVVVTITNPVEPDIVPGGPPTAPGEETGRPGTGEAGQPGRIPGGDQIVIPEPADGPLADLFIQIADFGTAAAADFAVQHGLDVERARELGGFYATQTVLGFQAAPISDTSESGFGSKLWSAVFAVLGAAIAGPAGAVGGYLFGSSLSTTHAAQEVTGLIKQATTAIQSHVHPVFSGTFSQVVNCLLCDHCENCQVADHAMQTALPQ